jgi:hypothetical protein
LSNDSRFQAHSPQRGIIALSFLPIRGPHTPGGGSPVPGRRTARSRTWPEREGSRTWLEREDRGPGWPLAQNAKYGYNVATTWPDSGVCGGLARHTAHLVAPECRRADMSMRS